MNPKAHELAAYEAIRSILELTYNKPIKFTEISINDEPPKDGDPSRGRRVSYSGVAHRVVVGQARKYIAFRGSMLLELHGRKTPIWAPSLREQTIKVGGLPRVYTAVDWLAPTIQYLTLSRTGEEVVGIDARNKYAIKAGNN